MQLGVRGLCFEHSRYTKASSIIGKILWKWRHIKINLTLVEEWHHIQTVQSMKHAQRKNQLTEKWSRECNISEAFKSYEQEVHPSGKTLSEVHKLWHVKVVTTFMKAGVPLAKVNHFRELLEENAYSLTDRRGICDLILNEHSRSNVWA